MLALGDLSITQKQAPKQPSNYQLYQQAMSNGEIIFGEEQFIGNDRATCPRNSDIQLAEISSGV